MVIKIGKLSVNVVTEKESSLKRGFISESDAEMDTKSGVLYG